jgi:hypothetical protein
VSRRPRESVGLTLTANDVEIGQVWWLPPSVHKYHAGLGRFCLIAHLERDRTNTPVRAHIIIGSKKRTSPLTIKVEPAEVGTPLRTYFRFWTSTRISVVQLLTEGDMKGKLAAARVPEIRTAISGSRLWMLKRLSGI